MVGAVDVTLVVEGAMVPVEGGILVAAASADAEDGVWEVMAAVLCGVTAI